MLDKARTLTVDHTYTLTPKEKMSLPCACDKCFNMKTRIKRTLRSTSLDQHTEAATSSTPKKCKHESTPPPSCSISEHLGSGDHDGSYFPENHVHNNKGLENENKKNEPLDLSRTTDHNPSVIKHSQSKSIDTELKHIRQNTVFHNTKEIITNKPIAKGSPQEIQQGILDHNNPETCHQNSETSKSARFNHAFTNMVPPSPVTNMVPQSPTFLINSKSQVNQKQIVGGNTASSVQPRISVSTMSMSSPNQLSNSQFTGSNHGVMQGHKSFIGPDSTHRKKQTIIPQYNGFSQKTTTADVAEASIAALQLVQELASNSESARNELPPINSVMDRRIQNLDLNTLTPVQEPQYQNLSNRLQSSMSSHSFFQNQKMDPVNQPFYIQKESQTIENMKEPQALHHRHSSQDVPVDNSVRLPLTMNYDPGHTGPADRAAPVLTDLSYTQRYCGQQVLPGNPTTAHGNQLESHYGMHRDNLTGDDMPNYAYGDHPNNIPPMQNQSQRFPEHSNGELGVPVMENRPPSGIRSIDNTHPYNNQYPLPIPMQSNQWNGPHGRFQSPGFQENELHSVPNIHNRSVPLSDNQADCLEDPLSPPTIMKKHKSRKKTTKRSAGMEQELPLRNNDSQFSGMLPQQQNKPTELWVVNPSYAMNVSHKTLMSQYIEFLIEENEQITEMSQSFSIPVDIIVTEDLYIMDIARKDTPFPTPKFLDWVHKCYPRIDVQSFIYRQARFTKEREMRRYYNYNMPPRQLLEDTFFYFQRKRMTRYCSVGPP
ncbi:hypothetical protein ScPMuIL_009626 [Solemya velum]